MRTITRQRALSDKVGASAPSLKGEEMERAYLVNFETYNYLDVVRVCARSKRKAAKIVKNHYGTDTIITDVTLITWM